MRCATAAEVYQYLNGGMVHQGISVDGLISVAEGLAERVRRGEVERRRAVAVRIEEGEGEVEVGSFKSAKSAKSAGSGSGNLKTNEEEAGVDEGDGSKLEEAGVSLVEACEVGAVSAAG